MAKILVGLSGGVDSAVTVKKLLSDCHEVAGLYLDMKDIDSEIPCLVTDAVGETADVASALQCAKEYGIMLYKYGCASEFDGIVKEYFAREYSLGRTPNPCVVCNRHVKIQGLLRCADILGFDYIATGHYAGIERNTENGRYYVKRGIDERKEQSYMLWELSQEQLSRLTLPLYETIKTENQEIARYDELDAASRGESLDICFIPKNESYVSFIEKRLGKFPEGDFISPDGIVCGKHKGIIRYTIGQRKGLGIALGEPVFVKSIDTENNRIYLARSGEEYMTELTLSDLNFQGMTPTTDYEGELYVKIRYAAKPCKATVIIKGEVCRIIFPTPVRAITPGQSAVLYDNDGIMFGGYIN